MATVIDYNNFTEDDSDIDYDSDYSGSEYSIGSYEVSAQEQWEESMKQIQALLSFVLFPLIGKLLGRRFSKVIWRRFADWWWL